MKAYVWSGASAPLSLIFRLLALMALLVPTRRSSADVFIYQLDPARSFLTLEGSTLGVKWAEQAPGSLKTSFRGLLAVNVSNTNLSFIRGSRVIAQTNGDWKPGYFGGAATYPADFGGQATLGSGRNAFHIDAAILNFGFDLSGDGIPYAGGHFDSTGIFFSTPTDINSALLIGSNGARGFWGQRPLDGYRAGDFITEGLMPPVIGEVASLIIPVDIEIPFLQTIAGPTAFHLTGQLVGVRSVSQPNPVLVWEFSSRNPQIATLLWESPYKLQTSATLASPYWIDTGAVPPYDIIINGSSGFFRVIR